MNGARESEVPRASPFYERNRDPGGVVAGSTAGVTEGDGVVGVGFVRPRQWSRGQSPRRYHLSQLLLGFRTRRTGRQKMRSATVCIAFVLTCTSGSFVAGMRYIDPQPGSNGDIGDKRVDLTEPSCDELRAMWRYTKRQSRAAKTNSGYPTYPYNPNIWPSAAGFPDRTKFSRGYTRARHAGRPRSRAAGGAPIYGRMVHKAPASSRWRNAMRGPGRKAFEDLTRAYGTVTRFRPNRITSFRVGGGISPPKSQIPQAGSFEALKNLIQAERARELKAQHIAEEMDTEIAAYRGGKEITDEEQEPSRDNIPRRYIPNLKEMTPKVNYDYNQRRYHMPRVGQAWSREPISPEYMSP
ncbi:uncharacterized protein [Linepithema humile]|uniref:uncharacterized protein isoform X2 n=1 Tax=Linepithema humile TaxID=83485 RepID=UPI00351F5783